MYLEKINSPADLKRLSVKELSLLAEEIRDEILEVVSKNGGHLASSLGAVELILALHYVFDAPTDQLVWDMGYQAYTHKLVTGRREQFHTLKQLGGLSGFSHRDESPYDLFTTGHGGTCISSALGLACARDFQKKTHEVVAIIGDAALGEGLALEGLNHVGHLKPDMLVILNDNEWSISRTIGAVSKYLNRIITNPVYNRIRYKVEKFLKAIPRVGKGMAKEAHRFEEGIKNLLVPGILFEELGFRYIGPIDGHNLETLIRTLKGAKELEGPLLLHVVTKKGKGYSFAEKFPEKFHKIEPFDLKSGEERRSPEGTVSFTDGFSEALLEEASKDSRVVAITAAMPLGTGLTEFARQFPDRFFDVGMAEQHAVTFAAGLARAGLKPVVAVYSTFFQRALDQIIHDLCIQNLPVLLAIDRAGLVGVDGITHHGIFDIAYLRAIPNLTLLSPKDPAELRQMLRFSLQQKGPVALRYARGEMARQKVLRPNGKIVAGRGELLRDGVEVAIVALGDMVYPSLRAAEILEAEGIHAAVVNARFIKPLDSQLLLELSQRINRFVTVENAMTEAGFGAAVMECFAAHEKESVRVRALGLPSRFIEHGKTELLLKEAGLTAEGIAEAVRQEVRAEKSYV